MTSTPVGIGVLGANSFVANAAVLPALDRSTSLSIAAVASLSRPVPERWQRFAVDDYEAVLDHPDVEAIYLPLPNGLHQEWTERAAHAGKHVLCEKPLAGDAATARSMAATCAEAGVLLAEAWMTPFGRRYRQVLDIVEAGEIGDVTGIDATFTFRIAADAADNYRWRADQGGGALLDVGIYCLGAIVEIFGADPIEVSARSQMAGGVDAATSARLTYGDDRGATISCSFIDEEQQRLDITGTLGRVVIDTEAFTAGVADCEYRVVDTRATDPLPVGSRHRSDANDSYQAMVEAFASAVRGHAEWPRPTERSIEMLELIDRIREAAE